MFYRLTQEYQNKIINQLAAQMSKALKREDERLAGDIAKKEAEQERKLKEKIAKEKAAIESIAEHRASVVRNLACSYSLLQLQSLAPITAAGTAARYHHASSDWNNISPGVLFPSPTSVLGTHLPGMWKTLSLGTGQS